MATKEEYAALSQAAYTSADVSGWEKVEGSVKLKGNVERVVLS